MVSGNVYRKERSVIPKTAFHWRRKDQDKEILQEKAGGSRQVELSFWELITTTTIPPPINLQHKKKSIKKPNHYTTTTIPLPLYHHNHYTTITIPPPLYHHHYRYYCYKYHCPSPRKFQNPVDNSFYLFFWNLHYKRKTSYSLRLTLSMILILDPKKKTGKFVLNSQCWKPVVTCEEFFVYYSTYSRSSRLKPAD